VPLDFALLSNVAEKVALIAFGALFNRFLERRPRVVVFYGHVGVFQLRGPQSGTVHTHSVVIRNSGRLTAHNVRVPHNAIPPGPSGPLLHISVVPDVAHSTNQLPAGGEELLFPVLVPGEQVTVSYLYFPPLTFNQINLPIRSDEGMARQINVLPTPQLPRWLLVVLWALLVIGVIAIIYAGLEAGRHFGVL
jgi:hypothetical protein